MSVKFAGSRNIDDRRRRRLAGENEGHPEPTPAIAKAGGYWKIHRPNDETCIDARSPIASLLPHGRVQVMLICCGFPLIMALVVSAMQWITLPADHPLMASLNLQTGFAWRFFTGLILLACAGTCWLISWFRSASVRDFDGCFKSWYWSGWVFAIFGIAAGCELHTIGAELLASYTRIEIPLLKSCLWMVLAAALLIEPARCFTREMWFCRRSWVSFVSCCFAMFSYLYATWSLHQEDQFRYAEAWQFVAALMSIMTPTLMFSALISQTHYVMYVTSDPVKKRQSWIIQGMIQACHRSGYGLSQAASGVALIAKKAAEKRYLSESVEEAKDQNSQQTTQKSTRKQVVKKVDKPVETVSGKTVKPQTKTTVKTEEASTITDASEPNVEKAPRKGLFSGVFGRKKSKSISEHEQTSSDGAEPQLKIAEKTTSARASVQKSNTSKSTAANTEEESSANKTQAKPRIRVKSEANSEPEQTVQETGHKNSAQPGRQASKPEKTPAEPRETVSIDTSYEDDDRLDSQDLKGLSKKERRRLRKMHRDQQRNKAA